MTTKLLKIKTLNLHLIWFFWFSSLTILIAQKNNNTQNKFILLEKEIEKVIENDLTKAKEYIALYKTWAEIDNIPKRKIQATIFQGDLLYHENKLLESTQTYLNAATEALVESPSLDSLVVYAYVYAAYNYNELNLAHKSLDILFKGLPFAKTMSDSSYLADYYSNIAGGYYYNGDLSESIKYWDSCIVVEKKLHDTTGIIKALNNIGKVNTAAKNYVKAIGYYKESIALLSNENKNSYLSSIIYGNIGETYLKVNEKEKAISNFNAALKIGQTLNDSSLMIKHLLSIGKVKSNSGKWELAFQYFKKAEKLIASNSYPIQKVDVFYFMALELLQQKKYMAANKLFLSAAQIAKKNKLQLKLKNIYEQLGALNEAQLNFKSTLHYKKLANTIAAQINEESHLKTITQLNAKYDYEKQIFNIENLKISNQLKALELEKLKTQKKWVLFLIAFLLLLSYSIFQKLKRTHQKNLAQKDVVLKEQNQKIESLQNKIAQQIKEEQANKTDTPTLESVNILIKTKLTPREFEILSAVHKGMTNKEIAEKHFVSINTVKFHLKNIYEKLEVNNRVQAIQLINH